MQIGAPVAHIVHDRTVRLVATARLRDPVLLKLVQNEDLEALAEIEGPTSGRLRVEQVGTDSLDRRELVCGIPHAKLINAAFSYWMPRAINRFNGPGRGAWYAAFTTETCTHEVAFHMERELQNVGDFQAIIDYAEVFASFIGDFVDVRQVTPKPDFLHPDPDTGYLPGNHFAGAVRAGGYYGIVYPSVRHVGGTRLVALVPHAIQAVAQGRVIQMRWTGKRGPEISTVGA